MNAIQTKAISLLAGTGLPINKTIIVLPRVDRANPFLMAHNIGVGWILYWLRKVDTLISVSVFAKSCVCTS